MKLSRNSKRYKQLARNLQKAREARRNGRRSVPSRAAATSLEAQITNALTPIVRDTVMRVIREVIG